MPKQQDQTGPMGKTELAERIASGLTGVSERQVLQMLDALTETVTGALQGGRSVALTGFGTFKVAQRKERSGVNLRTNERMTIPAQTVAKFTPGSRLKETMQGITPRGAGRAGAGSRGTGTRGQTFYASAPATGGQAEEAGGASGNYATERAVGAQAENAAPGGIAAGGQASAGAPGGKGRRRKAGTTGSEPVT